MSRYEDYDGEESFPNSGYLFMNSAQLALSGKRGRKALAELREALLALPEKRLIERALCTVGLPEKVAAMPATKSGKDWRTGEPFTVDNSERTELLEIVTEQGEGVCAVGALLWFRKVKAGMDPVAAFADLPTLPDTDSDISETAELAKRDAGLTYSLAWQLAYQNDEAFEGMTLEDRYVAFLKWIDRELAEPPLERAAPRDRKRRRRATAELTYPAVESATATTLELGL